MPTQQHIVKIYNLHNLIRLVLRDIERSHGVKPEGDLHYIAGLDARGNVFVRLDLEPMQLPDDHSQPEDD